MAYSSQSTEWESEVIVQMFQVIFLVNSVWACIFVQIYGVTRSPALEKMMVKEQERHNYMEGK